MKDGATNDLEEGKLESKMTFNTYRHVGKDEETPILVINVLESEKGLDHCAGRCAILIDEIDLLHSVRGDQGSKHEVIGGLEKVLSVALGYRVIRDNLDDRRRVNGATIHFLLEATQPCLPRLLSYHQPESR